MSRTSRALRPVPVRCLPVVCLLLAGCGDFFANIPARPAASDDPAVAEAEYPSLAQVPRRPQLSYTLEQRREIAQGLVADRANARHAGDSLRQDLGRPTQPDTAPPLPPLPRPEPPSASDPEADLAIAYVEEALARDADDGSLGDFLDRLERRPPVSAEARPMPQLPEEVPAVVELAPAPETAAAAAVAAPVVAAVEPVAPTSPAPVATPDDPPVVAAAAPGPLPVSVAAQPTLPLAVAFDPNMVELAADAAARLQDLARQVRGGSRTLVVSGGGARAGLAMERARRVAAMLVGGGVPPERIAIEMGGERDVVVVYEADA